MYVIGISHISSDSLKNLIESVSMMSENLQNINSDIFVLNYSFSSNTYLRLGKIPNISFINLTLLVLTPSFKIKYILLSLISFSYYSIRGFNFLIIAKFPDLPANLRTNSS
jgi:hypothetical protein